MKYSSETNEIERQRIRKNAVRSFLWFCFGMSAVIIAPILFQIFPTMEVS